MSRRILLSFLGRSEYKPCFYTYQGKQSTYTRFVQTAIYEFMKNDGEMDVVIFVTKEAKEENWHDKVKRKGEKLEGLETAFHRIAPEANVKLVEIESSQDEAANWQLFDAILQEIEEGDQIYFDITHSFRSIPFVALIVLNYARLVKKASIGKIMYGLFEQLGNLWEVDNIPPEKRLAPIVDVTNMAKLLDWTNGVDQFIRTGDASMIKQLTNTEVGKVFRDRSSKPEERRQMAELRGLADQLDLVGKSLQTSRSLQIAEEVKKLRQQLHKVRELETDAIKPLIPLLDEIEKKYEAFTDDELDNYFVMAKWCEENRLIQPGLTLLQENCVTAICRVFHIDKTDKNKRSDIHSAIRILLERIPKEKWRVRDINFVEEMIDKLQPYREWLKPFNAITEYRNDINHAGTSANAREAKVFYNQLSKSLKELKLLFEKMSEISKEKTV
ncbi:TIGR02221 family CRISPR-associated protein [Aeribacillus pallidus]|uniref:TIGR02221 family CRISPR-associated protein n=1 Tax=Aeribacillus pallidus TaxID=33936 RepID=UPI003D1AA6A2